MPVASTRLYPIADKEKEELDRLEKEREEKLLEEQMLEQPPPQVKGKPALIINRVKCLIN